MDQPALMNLKLVHYAAQALVSLRSIPPAENPDRYFKPHGLWVSVEGDFDWPSWCEAEDFGTDRLACAHDVVLARNANVLHLVGGDALDDFTARYARERHAIYRGLTIDWHAVADDFQGIVIAPYVWSRRLCRDAQWYYGWDCASGCIWDAAAVASITLREASA